MFARVYAFEPATLAFFCRHASQLSSRAQSPNYTYRENSPAPRRRDELPYWVSHGGWGQPSSARRRATRASFRRAEDCPPYLLPQRLRPYELPPIPAGSRWFGTPPTLPAEFLALLEVTMPAGRQATNRTGMNLWQILYWALSGWAWTQTGIAWNTSQLRFTRAPDPGCAWHAVGRAGQSLRSTNPVRQRRPG